MSEAYEKVRGGRLSFKGGELATREKAIDKTRNKKKKNKNKKHLLDDTVLPEQQEAEAANASGVAETYTIDAAKKMKYEELFPVETKKFGYDPKAKAKSVEDALDDRVKKKADRYCKWIKPSIS